MNATLDRTHTLHDQGLAYIRTAIRATLLVEVDVEMASAGILHSASSRRLPPPEVVRISIMPAHAPVVTVEFTGREIQECSRGVEGAEVVRKIGSYAEEYKRWRMNGGHDRRRHGPVMSGRASGGGEGRPAS